MNEHGRKRATFIVATTLILASLSTTKTRAEEPKPVSVASSPALPTVTSPVHPAVDVAPAAPAGSGSQGAATTVVSVSLFENGAVQTFQTYAATVGGFLAERGIVPTAHDAVSLPPDTPLRNGMNVAFRHAIPVTLVVDGASHPFTTSAQNVGEFLASANVKLGKRDELSPASTARIVSDMTVDVVRVACWKTHRRESIPVAVLNRTDRTMQSGTVLTTSAGRTGLADVETTFERRDGVARQVSVVDHVLRAPQDRVIVHGTGRIGSLASIARTGFNATVRFAGQALSMIATAYTAACYGCSGITASGVPAGHGVVAVDPAFIPLGTKLFIPGYGNAVAGDTGGAIVGNRIDLGFDSNAAALDFGRRPITVYVLK